MVGRYLWMHNGVVGGFARIKRAILEVRGREWKGKRGRVEGQGGHGGARAVRQG